MNPNDPNQSMQGIIGPQQKQELSSTPSVGSLPEADKQKKVDELAQTVLKRVFQRIVHVLVEEDMKMIANLDKDDSTGNIVKYFLMTKVPNLEKIVQEEVEFLKQELQTSSPSS